MCLRLLSLPPSIHPARLRLAVGFVQTINHTRAEAAGVAVLAASSETPDERTDRRRPRKKMSEVHPE